MGEPFQWDSASLGLGIEAMDEQHRKLISLMNRLQDLSVSGESAGISTILKELYNFTIYHFREEEIYMESISYPDFEGHRYVHKDLLRRLEGYTVDFEKTGVLNQEIFDFLVLWLTAHIRMMDTRYSEFSREK